MACAQAVAAVAIRGAPTTARLHPAATRDLPPLHIPHMANDEYDPVLANPVTTRLVPDDAVAACGREGIVKHIIPQSKVHDRDDRCDSSVAWLLFFVSARTNKRHHHHQSGRCYLHSCILEPCWLLHNWFVGNRGESFQ
jgi:hypothetical protein